MISIFTLILVNIIPLLGVVIFGWDIFTLVFAYWTENLVIGFYNVLKMKKLTSSLAHPDIRFFVIHFGFFTIIHGLLLVFIFNMDKTTGQVFLENINWQAIMLASLPLLAGSLVSHGISYYKNFLGKNEYQSKTLKQLLFAPYGRIISMHLVILVGGYLVKDQGHIIFLVMLVMIKLITDFTTHYLLHIKYMFPRPPAGTSVKIKF